MRKPHNNIGIVLAQQNKHDEAIEHYDRALLFRPDYAEAHMNRALSLLGRGEFLEGWSEYEWRWKTKEVKSRGSRRTTHRHWDGSSLDGKSLLVYYEQGLGDTIQFVRYLKQIKQRGGRVLLAAQKALHPILKTVRWIDQLVDPSGEMPPFDIQVPLLSLPGILGTTLDNIPADTPYITASEELVEKWRERLASFSGFKIGIAWQGNKDYRGDKLRSMALSEFSPIADLEGVTLFSLQKGEGSEQIDDFRLQHGLVTFDDLDSEAGPFMDTAAIMANMDLIVTSDTAIPHLAGALGVPVWMAVPVAADWRWLENQEDCPWYPSMKMFRQREVGEWKSVFSKIASRLAERLKQHRKRSLQNSAGSVETAAAVHAEGVKYFQSGDLANAESNFRQACDLNQDASSHHHDLGVVLAKDGKLQHAISCFDKAIELDRGFASAYGNLGLAQLESGLPDDAAFNLRKAIHLGATNAETHNNLAIALVQQGRVREAIDVYKQALLIDPEYAEAHTNMSRALLLLGDFKEGWKEYEWRWKCASHERREFRQRRWGGDPLNGQRVLIYAEQGLGDTIQFVRFAAQVQQLGAEVIVECQQPLKQLLSRTPGIDQLVGRQDETVKFDFQCPMMSLPALLKTTVTTIPKNIPYVRPDPELIELWRERLSFFRGFRVGVCWQGNPDYSGDHLRSVSLAHWKDICNLRGVNAVSLQKGPGAEQIAAHPEVSILEPDVEFDEDNGAFCDTAALIKNLDLVVTSDTAIAHLAGAMGVPVWVVIPKSPDFRWLEEREDCPWYPSMRLFRQIERGDWSHVFKQVEKELLTLVESRERFGRSGSTSMTLEERAKGLHSAGVKLVQNGRLHDAIEQFQNSILADPNAPETHNDLGVVYGRLNQTHRAIQSFKRALTLDPQFFGANKNLGLAFLETGRPREALPHLVDASQVEPGNPNICHQIAIAHFQLNDLERAIDWCNRTLQAAPDFAEAANTLGNVLREANRVDEAIAAYDKAILHHPEFAQAHKHRANALVSKGEFNEALDAYRRAIKLDPNYAEAYNNLGVLLADMQREEDAVEAFRDALRHRPDHPETHRNLGIVLLMTGQFREGWTEYEWRLKTSQAAKHPLPFPMWNGEAVEDATILIQAEQGLGDTIQFIRYAVQVKERCKRVIVQAQPAVRSLLQRVSGVDEVCVFGAPIPKADLYIPILSLPYIFGTTIDQVPATVPYFDRDPETEVQWSERLQDLTGRRIAISWQGSQSYGGDIYRSVPLRSFASISDPSIDLISIQAGVGLDQLSCVDFPVHHFEDLDREVPFLDTVGILSNVEMCITSDTAVAHLAGALGVTTWMPTCQASDWRWLRQREDCPWYPTMRLFRQSKFGDWKNVFERIANELGVSR